MGGNLAPFGTGTYALDWLWAVVIRDWSTKISLATPLEAIIEVTHVWMGPAFSFVPHQACRAAVSFIGPE